VWFRDGVEVDVEEVPVEVVQEFTTELVPACVVEEDVVTDEPVGTVTPEYVVTEEVVAGVPRRVRHHHRPPPGVEVIAAPVVAERPRAPWWRPEWLFGRYQPRPAVGAVPAGVVREGAPRGYLSDLADPYGGRSREQAAIAGGYAPRGYPNAAERASLEAAAGGRGRAEELMRDARARAAAGQTAMAEADARGAQAALGGRGSWASDAAGGARSREQAAARAGYSPRMRGFDPPMGWIPAGQDFIIGDPGLRAAVRGYTYDARARWILEHGGAVHGHGLADVLAVLGYRPRYETPRLVRMAGAAPAPDATDGDRDGAPRAGPGDARSLSDLVRESGYGGGSYPAGYGGDDELPARRASAGPVT
jgi:hypothetical protein